MVWSAWSSLTIDTSSWPGMYFASPLLSFCW